MWCWTMKRFEQSSSARQIPMWMLWAMSSTVIEKHRKCIRSHYSKTCATENIYMISHAKAESVRGIFRLLHVIKHLFCACLITQDEREEDLGNFPEVNAADCHHDNDDCSHALVDQTAWRTWVPEIHKHIVKNMTYSLLFTSFTSDS